MNAKFRFLNIFLSLLLIVGLFSCENKDENKSKGILKISFVPGTPSSLKALKDSINSDASNFSSYQLLVSVADENGELVLNHELYPLYSFGDGFITEDIQLMSGDYFLKEFMVLDNYGQVVFASPIAGSERAYLVNNPLPLYIRIMADEITEVAPEVLPVDSFPPSAFGYASFQVQVVYPVSFYVIAIDDNPMLMRPTSLIPAQLFISTASGWSYSAKLQAGLNKLVLRSSDSYVLTAWAYENTFGKDSIRIKLSLEDIKNTTENAPYVIKFGSGSQYHTLVLQPGPEDGKDARITDLEPERNFGDYPYFEATFQPEPILTVMRTTRSLISFSLNSIPKSASIEKVILRLSYDIPVYWEPNGVKSDTNSFWFGAVLQQIIEPWEENMVTWNNQPATTAVGQVMVTPFVKNSNMVEYDVTRLFVPDPFIDSIPFPNYGIMFKFSPENAFPGFRFASSDFKEAGMRPMLTVYYTLP